LRAVVTGCAGFIGSHLTEKLLEEGFRVVGIDNLSTGRVENIEGPLGHPGFKFVKADLLSASGWQEEVRGADVVFHLAANPEVRQSVADPMSHYDQNLTGTVRALEAARSGGAKLFVFASSSTVYGDAQAVPTPEDHPLKPVSIYGATKAAGELFCATYSRLYGIKCLSLRYANVVGPRLRHGVIYDFLIKLSRDPLRLEILGDGTQRKSYIHVEDAVRATLLAAEKLLGEEASSEVYNVGNRDWVSVMEIARVVAEAMGLGRVEFVKKAIAPEGRGWPGDVKLMLLDISKIEREVGWSPSMPSLDAVRRAARELYEELFRGGMGAERGA